MKKKYFKIIKIGIIAIVLVVILAGILLLANSINKKEEKEIITKTTLEKIINVSELSTFEMIYNGIAEKMNEEKTENVDYYVYYESKVKAGIDFEQVEIDVDHNAKKIVVTIPEVEITEVNVDIASMEYMFYNKKANTKTVSQEAYKLCKEDATNESSKENAIYELAEQNAKNVIEALISPFVQQLDEEYILEIN